MSLRSDQQVASSPLATSSPLVHGPRAADADSPPRAGADAPPGWRRSGVLLHVTSLPGADGIGDLGAPARRFVEWLSSAGQRLWQTLPLHPASTGATSPYHVASAFAGDPLLVSLDDLVTLGLLPDTLDAIRSSVGAHLPRGDDGMVADRAGGADAIASASRWKLPLVRQAARQLLSLPPGHELMRRYLAFCEREAWWLADYVAFVALRERFPGVPRGEWPLEERVRRLGAHRARALEIGATHQHPEAAVQFLFDMQLRRLHEHARQHDVWLVGDAPTYVGDDSADVWAHPDLFLLDEQHRPRVRTGAPPDAMDPAGQVWPMPAYDWAANAAASYEWWLRRLRHAFAAADALRIQHFRAFADWWSVPPRAHYAEQGRWEPGPGAAFLEVVRRELGELELVVDDLGVETEPLRELRRAAGLPQMRVLVQGLDEGGASRHLPTAWSGTEAAYTGTHDFDTIAGWAHAAARAAAQDPTDQRLAFALRFTGAGEPNELPRAAIEMVQRSSARFAIVPLQDWLGLEGHTRIGAPGPAHDRWRWTAPRETFSDALAAEMAVAAARGGRGRG